MTRMQDGDRTLITMTWLIVLAAGVAAVVAMLVADRLGWIDLSNKADRPGSSGGGVFTMMDEVFAPTRHETQAEYDRQTQLPVPAPTPSGNDHDLLSGRVLIRIPSTRPEDRGPARVETHDRSY
jgi:hypothetical protein